MKGTSPRPGRMPWLAPLVAACFVAVGLAMAVPAAAVPTLYGGQLYYTGGDVTIDVLSSDTAYGEVLRLWSDLTVLDVTDGTQVDTRVTLTAKQLADMDIGVGDELNFGIHVLNTGQDFVLGPGDRNVDGLDHAYVRSGRTHVIVGFEDLLGGGDRDYNDTIFRFAGGTTTTGPPIGIAEPSALLLLLPGIGVLGLLHRNS